MIKRSAFGWLCAGLGLLPLSAAAQLQTPLALTPVDVTGFGSANTYTQNFNGLDRAGPSSNALPAGWGFTETGDLANDTYAPSTGSTGVGNTYSFGASGSVNGATDRTFGTVQNTSSGTTLAAALGVAFRNQTGRPIDGFRIRFRGEQWRNGNSARAAPDRLDCAYVTTTSTPAASLVSTGYTAFPELSFSSRTYATAPAPGAGVVLDGNAPANAQVVTAVLPVRLAAGATLYLRWTDVDVSGPDDGLGIDDFELTAYELPDLGTAAPVVATLGTTVGGTVSSTGTNGPVTERGVVYSATNANPTLGGAGTTAVAVGNGPGAFSTELSGLAGFTTYYVAAYATNADGSSYGPVETFETGAGAVSIGAMNTPYEQNFDALAATGSANPKNTLPAGWDFVEVVPAAGAGSSAPDNTYATVGSNVGNTYSLGAAGSSERALGTLQNSGVQSTIGATFVNATPETIVSVRVSYTGEMWRYGGSASTDRLEFSYSTDAASLTTGTFTAVPALHFASPVRPTAAGALDGNAADNHTPLSATFAVSVPPGGLLTIRWSDIGIAGTDDALAVEDFALTAFSSTPLPVELTEFTAASAGAAVVQLRWRTASEQNSAYFALERSADGRTFETLAQVPAQGSTTTATAYAWHDARLPAAARTLYYRLRQVDRDGTTAYSPVRVVQAGGAGRPLRFAVYPTAVAHGQLRYHSEGAAPDACVELYSGSGQLLRRQALAQGEVSVADLAPGWYLARLLSGREARQARFYVP